MRIRGAALSDRTFISLDYFFTHANAGSAYVIVPG